MSKINILVEIIWIQDPILIISLFWLVLNSEGEMTGGYQQLYNYWPNSQNSI